MHPDSQRVMLLDDHPIVLEGLQQRLAAAPHLQVVGAYNTGSALMQALTVATEPVHLAIVDFSLGPDEVDGIKLLRALRVRFPRTAVLVLSSHYNPATVSLALQAGAHGFLSKTQGAEALLDAIRQILAGRTYLPEDMRQQLADLSRLPPVPGETPGRVAEALTPREQEVLRCTLEGMTPSEISAKFSRAISTISTQKKSGFHKLGIRNDAELFKVRSLIEKT